MRAFEYDHAAGGLVLVDRSVPEPGPGQLVVHVRACGVCRTDLHVVDDELPNPLPRVVPGHEIVGRVVAIGEGVAMHQIGERVGIPWLAWTCGTCEYCTSERENLCPNARFAGYTWDGGYAEYALADARYCFALPERYSDTEAAPLLCAGLIGFRAYRMAQTRGCIGIYGFGAAAHLVAQVAMADGCEVHAFTRAGDVAAQAFARELGATYAGPSDVPGPKPLDAALLFAPVGALIPLALAAVKPGATVVCAGIHMSEIPSFPYELLWMERRIVSVANLTRKDAREFLSLAARVRLRTAVTVYPLESAPRALDDLRRGAFQGAAVLVPAPDGAPPSFPPR